MSIAEFVVGLGIESTGFDKGIKKAEGQLNVFKSSVLQTGAALAGAFSFKALAFDFARQVNEARQFAQLIGVSADSLTSMQRVADSFGASLGDLNGLMMGLAQAKAGINVGEIGVLQDLAKNGINIDSIIGAKDANDAILRLSDQLKGLNKEARLNVANALGLSPQTFDMLIQGREQIEQLQKKMKEIRPTTERMTQASKEWTAGLSMLTNNIGGVSDKLSTELISTLNVVIGRTNTWFDANREVINALTGSAMKAVAENVDKIAIAFGTLTGAAIIDGLGALVAKMGGLSALVGGLAATATRVAGAFALLMLWDEDPEKFFGEKWGKALKMNPAEFAQWLFSNQDQGISFDQGRLEALQSESDESGSISATSGAIEGGAAIVPAAASSELFGSSTGASQAQAQAVNSRATVKANIPIQVRAVTNVAGSTIEKVVTNVMNREFDAALIRNDYGN